MAKKLDRDDWLKLCKAEILKHAGPFTGFSEDASEELDAYLADEEIQVGAGEPRTRWRWSSVPEFRATFFQRLQLLGLHAKYSAARRQQVEAMAGEPSPDLLDLQLGDLKAAQQVVEPVSGTSFCTPGRDPD